MNVKLYDLNLRNFKGIRDMALSFDGGDAIVSGANATGKTTLMDAFTWLLFGKDSLNRADFEIKPLDDRGEAEHGLEHEVSATLEIDGSTLELRKVLTEKWTKKRGSATQEFTGHTIDHFIDGVPCKESDYKARIKEIAPEETFRLLTNPRYFSESMKWQERRRLLLEVCGDISDADVIASNEKLTTLPDMLGKHSLEDYRKILAGKKTEINKQLGDIPVRISEQQRNIVDAGVQDGPARAKRAELQNEKKGLDAQLSTLETGGAIAEKKRELAEIETKLIRLQNQEAHAADEAADAKRKELGRMKFGLGNLEAECRTLSAGIAANSSMISSAKHDMDKLRGEWTAENATEFRSDETCPNCGQSLPAAMLETARANFNERKAERMAAINAKGKGLKGQCETWEAENAAKQASLAARQGAVNQLATEIGRLEGEINNPPPATDQSLEMGPLYQQKKGIEQEIVAVAENRQDAINEIKGKIEALETQIQDLNATLAQIDQDRKSMERIKALKAEGRTLAGEYEALERELYLTEEFVRAKVFMLEDKINSRFQLARFKLFNPLINGGVEECCEITVDGVPYWSANNAARINAGIDVCNALSAHYGISLVMWIDNAEAVNEVLPSIGQQIKLVVSTDKTLHIQIGEKRNGRTESIAA